MMSTHPCIQESIIESHENRIAVIEEKAGDTGNGLAAITNTVEIMDDRLDRYHKNWNELKDRFVQMEFKVDSASQELKEYFKKLSEKPKEPEKRKPRNMIEAVFIWISAEPSTAIFRILISLGVVMILEKVYQVKIMLRIFELLGMK